MTDQFDSMVDDNTPAQTKLKNYTAGNEQSRWASVLTSFFESVGIETRRDAQSASNIDAVENLSKYPERFLEILQRVVPQPFTFGQQPAAEANDQFGDLLQEMLPIRDEDRADLKRMLGRSMPEHELEMIISNGGQLVQLIQQNFPELNIQMEGVYDVLKGAGRLGLKGLKQGGRYARWGGEKAIDAMNKFSSEMGTPHDISNNQDASGLAGFLAGGRRSGMNNFGDESRRDRRRREKPLTPQENEREEKISDEQPREDKPGTTQNEPGPSAPTIGRNFKKEWKKKKNNLQELYRSLRYIGVDVDGDGFKEYQDLIPDYIKNGSPDIPIPDAVIEKIHAKLKQEQLSENLIMKRTFNDIVQHAGEQLLEAPEDEMAAADPAMDPAAAEAPPPPPVEEPMADAVPDDMDKLQTDMLELVRRALIINPKDIDQESYMQLTTRVNFDNMQQVKPLLLKLVQNHYPDLDMGDVPKGPGT